MLSFSPCFSFRVNIALKHFVNLSYLDIITSENSLKMRNSFLLFKRDEPIAKTWKQRKCPSMDEWIKKM